MDLTEIDASLLDGRTKGMPGGIAPFPLRDIGRHGWNVLREDLPLPLAVLKESALAHNSAWMRDFLARSGAVIAPHGKTTMAPQLFARQLADGAWGMTLATPQQVAVARSFGVSRIVMANQLVGRAAMRFVLEEIGRDPAFDFYCIVDSVEHVGKLAAAAQAVAPGRPLQVLLEGGIVGGRTGVRDRATGLAVARAVQAAAPHLALRGVEGFEGLVGGTRAEMEAQVRAFLDLLVGLAQDCEGAGLFAPGEIILSAGGSAFYDMVIARFRNTGLAGPVRLLTRSGCYLTHDAAMYRRAFADIVARSPEVLTGGGLEPALEVWAYVQSRPEPGKVLMTMGKRDVSADEPPLAQAWFRPGAMTAPQPVPPGHVVTAVNDQHIHMALPAESPLGVGDMVSFGVSHPCLTFDKWQVIVVVDDAYNVVSAIRTFF
jgi:D-serine dehydratase